ncbi:hypothetical protein [Bifidobacterium vansinderenii]|uniref:Uncharacterized protein n=1 Tax=Bifidobacterium vansinderenii TaxID=1984871 RepID=A0A229VXP3_9BIFI|nr:hypothetical protein [Bifidobacterium vansinderenii]OXN00381.1 hypothetical protein Tam10B_1251 [Bifidobacterium vansinderenii]
MIREAGIPLENHDVAGLGGPGVDLAAGVASVAQDVGHVRGVYRVAAELDVTTQIIHDYRILLYNGCAA